MAKELQHFKLLSQQSSVPEESMFVGFFFYHVI